MNNTTENGQYFVAAFEPGAEHPALPTWASCNDNGAELA
ncbi:oxidoreductase, partial [Shewanella sp. SR41-2]|nr:oxidoreductase [Shewanella sp. SR41-2]